MMMKLSRGERILELTNYAVLLVLCLVFLVPLLSVVSTSFISVREYATRGQFILFPQQPSLDSYRFLLRPGSIVWNGYLVSIWRVCVGTLLNLAFTFPLAYVLARRRLVGRTFLTMFVFVTMIFSGGLVPTFLIVENMNMINSVWSMIIPSLINPWWMLIMRNFIMGIPEEIEEAAIVDGANPLVVMVKIIIPLSLPSIATIGLFYAVGHWNAWFDAAIYISDRAKYPLQIILRSILQAGMGFDSTGTGGIGSSLEMMEPPPTIVLQSAMIVATTLPILVVYPFIQRYFVRGMLVGSVKG